MNASVKDFIINLVEAVAIVIAVLCITMGLTSGMLMGVILLLTIFGTLIGMNFLDIDFQMISLGVLILAMIFTVVVLFNAVRQTVIIFMCLPLVSIGVTAGLLLTGHPFGFMCILGYLGLSGMIIKNAVVLIDQIDLEIRDGKNPYQAILDSSVSRLRPVSMASLTTILGMLPLLKDVFFVGMSITIIGGLAFGTVLTLLVVPVLYSVFFRIRSTSLNNLI